MAFGLPDGAERMDCRCGTCGEWMYAEETRPDSWTLKCGCGAKIVGTDIRWLRSEFCKPYPGTGADAPLIAATA